MSKTIDFFDYIDLVGEESLVVGVIAESKGLRRDNSYYQDDVLTSLTKAERDALRNGPAVWPTDKYALTFPCSLQELRETLGVYADALDEELSAEFDCVSVKKSTVHVVQHTTNGKRNTPLSTEIAEAKKRANDPENALCVWGELTKMAEQKCGVLIGYSSDGVQYRGQQYQEKEEPDVFTTKNLRDRMYRARKRAKTRESA
jgi:hypothetical protein